MAIDKKKALKITDQERAYIRAEELENKIDEAITFRLKNKEVYVEIDTDELFGYFPQVEELAIEELKSAYEAVGWKFIYDKCRGPTSWIRLT